MARRARNVQRSLEQVYTLEGWRGVAKRLPELEGRTDSAKRSAVYRIVRGYPNQPKQAISEQAKTNINRRAGRLLARKTLKDEKGKTLVDEEGEPMKAPISPQNHSKLAIAAINTRRLENRREATKLYNSGAITKDEYEVIMAKNKRLTKAQKDSIEQEAQEQDWVAFKASYQSRMGQV
mgnify:CR=1 FL=1|jgi:hypothetical protein